MTQRTSKRRSASRVLSAEFTGSFQESASLPNHEHLEVCLLGRSNVGKSSLLNRLTERHGLARVGRTPGRTQALNRFEVSYRSSKREQIRKIVLLDLPGFGFAAQGKEKMESYGILLEDYLEARQDLGLILLLQDIRREPGSEELTAQVFAAERGIPFTVVITKCDKLSRTELRNRTNQIATCYGLGADELIVTGEGIELGPLWKRIDRAASDHSMSDQHSTQ